ncbi:MAG: protein kinase, partial [Myxococcales bacterium]|nr:protein kinase [Myxococcales bacterium]
DPRLLVAAAARGERRALARLVSVFEDSRTDAAARRREALAALDERGAAPRALCVGFTGTPGAGKSSLLGVVAKALVERDPTLSVAVVAVDPASVLSGGALLGDRTRVTFPAGERRLYFRSQSSERALGGLGRTTFHVCRVLERLFDVLFVETVGIGQSEIEVREFADRVYLVLQPLAGDQVQFMKAGIMEIPDAFVVNKCDEERAARRSLHALRASLSFARPGDDDRLPIFSTSAATGLGVDALVEDIARSRTSIAPRGLTAAARAHFERWVATGYGELGLRYLAGVPALEDVDAAELSFDREFRRWVCEPPPTELHR